MIKIPFKKHFTDVIQAKKMIGISECVGYLKLLNIIVRKSEGPDKLLKMILKIL